MAICTACSYVITRMAVGGLSVPAPIHEASKSMYKASLRAGNAPVALPTHMSAGKMHPEIPQCMLCATVQREASAAR